MSKRVMIVDDSLFVFEEMKNMLLDSEFEIAGYAKSGEEALEMFESVKPDLVTMDLILPGIDGMDAAEAILKKWPDCKVIIVSSLAYDDTVEQAKNIGAKHFLFKPFEKEQLLGALAKAHESP